MAILNLSLTSTLSGVEESLLLQHFTVTVPDGLAAAPYGTETVLPISRSIQYVALADCTEVFQKTSLRGFCQKMN